MMNTRTHSFLACCSAWVLLLPSVFAAAAPDPKTGTPTLSDFNIIQERNIFNPNRYVRSNNQRRSSPRSVASDSLILTGVMAYDKGTYAFFDGSSSAYRKVVSPGESLAGLKVAEIQTDSVKLLSGTNELDVPVGTQMRKEEGGDWYLAGRVEFASSTPPSTSRTSSVGPPSTPPPTTATNDSGSESQPEFFMPMAPGEPGGFADGGAPPPPDQVTPPQADQAPNASDGPGDDILRRLRERREQEMNE